ncbi:transcriptional antiterminator, BglG family [Pelagirhabdus alkalitolerans]|uniref:Transcriptional antiterminator, BglG family n=1 Tax=Pelagirhabdus alkalitolerans TaxID=1612202 RepID=A0A1G6GG72_9BACI|nr:BglG family transcription antiterminator [Pelagirhabdus alkalitolerans]SDB81008.1 transcriptional antiterminator, BglG family [Pelagirhabdus alkalitolerans]
MNKRSLYILNLLITPEEQVTLSSLSEHFNVSRRTIYNDLNEVRVYLGRTLGIELQKRGGIYYIELPNKDAYYLVLKEIEDQSSELNEIDPIKRVDYQIFILVMINNQGITTEEIASKLNLSLSTIKSDRSKVVKRLSEYNLKLETKKFKGSRIIGNEEDVRDLLIRMIFSDYEVSDFNEIDDFYVEYLDNESTKNAGRLITDVSESMNINYVDKYLNYIRVSLSISFMRISQKNLITNKPKVFKEIFSKEYEHVNRFLTEYYPILINEKVIDNETIYLTSKFQKSSYYTQDVSLQSDNWIYYQFLIKELIYKISNELGMNLSSDEELYKGLYQHLRPAIYRLLNNIYFENPIKNDVIQKYPKLYIVVKRNLSKFESIYKVRFNQDEITYIVLLFASGFEKKLNTFHKKPSIVVVCQEGVSTASILKSELNKNFDLTIVGTYSKDYFLKIQPKLIVDFVISTIELNESPVDYIKVSPLLNNNDKNKLTEHINIKQTSVDIHEFIYEIAPYITIDNYSGLENKLNLLLNSKGNKDNAVGGEILLKDVVTDRLIETNVEVDNAQEAVIAAGKLLLKEKLIEEQYIDAMVNTFTDNGPYIVIAPGIAMPHARPEKGALDIGISIITLEKPVKFGHPKNDPVNIVIGLCAIDHQSHLTALSELMDILSDEKSIEKINEANTSETILKIVKGE